MSRRNTYEETNICVASRRGTKRETYIQATESNVVVLVNFIPTFHLNKIVPATDRRSDQPATPSVSPRDSVTRHFPVLQSVFTLDLYLFRPVADSRNTR